MSGPAARAHPGAPDPALVDRLAGLLDAGEAVVLPTDTVYGVAVSPAVPGAADRLFALKERGRDAAVAVLVADAAQALALARAPVDPAVRRVMERLWPGPLTLVLDRGEAAAPWDLGGDPASLGVRCPDHDLVRALARRVGALAVTSANRHGRPTPARADEAAAALVGPVAAVVDGGPRPGAASTVVDVRGGDWALLRPGPLGLDDVRAAAVP